MRQHRASRDERRYWRARTVLEFVKMAVEVAVEVALDVLHGGFRF